MSRQTPAALSQSFRQGQGASVATTTSRLFQQSAAASATPNDNHQEKMVARHRESTARHDTVVSEAQHLLHQKRVFDEMSDFFATKQTIPAELLPVYRHLAGQIWGSIRFNDNKGDTTIRILDVACGTGALFSFLMEQQQQQQNAQPSGDQRRLEITGVDLSPRMVAAARQQAEALMSSSSPDTIKIEVVESDVLQYKSPITDSSSRHLFDAIIVNACYGNFCINGS